MARPGTPGGRTRRARVVWVSTSLTTRGGVSSVVRAMSATPLWSRWSVRHVATHQDGSAAVKVLRYLRGVLHFWALLLLWRPDLAHIHTSASGSFVRKALLAWSAYLRGVPVVLHVHAGGFVDFHDALPPPLRRVVRATLERAAVVVALGPTWAGRLAAIAPAATVEVVPNAVPLVEPAPRGPRSGTGPVQVLFLGKLGDEKGVPLLLDAWARVQDELPTGTTARLVAAGDGEVDRFRRRVDELGLASVELPGWVSSAEVVDLLRTADLLVLPSVREGQPMAVLEAMSHGVPVVATAVGGVPDLVDDRSGLLVGSGDLDALTAALLRLVCDPALRATLGEGGRARVREELSVDATWRRLDRLYTGLVGPPGS